MKLITRQDLANTVAERWRKQYQLEDGSWRQLYIGVGDSKSIFIQLIDLGPQPKPDDINKIIGNGTWTGLTCDECDRDVDEVVQLGEQPNYDSSTASICRLCLRQATELY